MNSGRTRAISTLIAIGALVAVGCTAGPRTSPSAVQAASPMPTTTPSTSIAVPTASPRVALPTALRYLWVGETRAIPGLTPPAVQSGLDLAHSEMGVYAQATGQSILDSAASLDGPTASASNWMGIQPAAAQATSGPTRSRYRKPGER